jgi:hypothetical protein
MSTALKLRAKRGKRGTQRGGCPITVLGHDRINV